MSANDLRSVVGKEVFSRDGETVGHVTGIVDQPGQESFLEVKHDGLLGIGTTHFLVPWDAVTAAENGSIRVDKTKEDLTGVPVQDAVEPHRPEYFKSLYTWWWRADVD